MTDKKTNKKIIIVEDELDIGEIMQITLVGAGYQVKVLLNGKDIEDHIKKFDPSLILMDLWMPGLDGSSLTKKLKINKETKNIPIIIVSACNALAKTAKSCGADGFLSKPFDIKNLISIVKKFI